jgi:hypothetical protein
MAGKKGAKQPTRQSTIKGCAVCLYRVGFGYTTIGKILCRNKALPRKWVKASGVELRKEIKSSKPHSTKPGHKPKIIPIFPDLKVFRVGDEQTHWLNHPEVAKWAYRQNAEAIKQKTREYYRKVAIHRPGWIERRKAEHRQWRLKNKDKCKAINERWRRNNPEKWRALAKAQRQKPKNKIANNLRRRLRDFVKKGLRKQATTALVGCSKDDLVKWIEGQFKRGMRWDNYGEWHIDHKDPCAMFDLTDEAQQRICFHYSNLRPMWGEDNIAKGAKIIPNHQPELLLSICA